MGYPSWPGGGKRGSPADRKAVENAANEDEDLASRSSGTYSYCFGFVAYFANRGEKLRVRMKTFPQRGSYSCTSRRDPDSSLIDPATPSASPSSCPSPRKLPCTDQREPEDERRERHPKRRAQEGNSSDLISLLWLG